MEMTRGGKVGSSNERVLVSTQVLEGISRWPFRGSAAAWSREPGSDWDFTTARRVALGKTVPLCLSLLICKVKIVSLSQGDYRGGREMMHVKHFAYLKNRKISKMSKFWYSYLLLAWVFIQSFFFFFKYL